MIELQAPMNVRALEHAVRAYADLPVHAGDGDGMVNWLSKLYNAFDAAMVAGSIIGMNNAVEIAKGEIERVRWQSYDDGREMGHSEGYVDGVRDARNDPALADCIITYGATPVVSNEALSKTTEYANDYYPEFEYEDALAKDCQIKRTIDGKDASKYSDWSEAFERPINPSLPNSI